LLFAVCPLPYFTVFTHTHTQQRSQRSQKSQRLHNAQQRTTTHRRKNTVALTRLWAGLILSLSYYITKKVAAAAHSQRSVVERQQHQHQQQPQTSTQFTYIYIYIISLDTTTTTKVGKKVQSLEQQQLILQASKQSNHWTCPDQRSTLLLPHHYQQYHHSSLAIDRLIDRTRHDRTTFLVRRETFHFVR